MEVTVFSVILTCCFVIAVAQQHGDLRLMGSTNSHTGRVEIYMDGVWGTIDAGTITSDQLGPGQTVCRQLGFYNSILAGTVSDLSLPQAADNVPMQIQQVTCPYNVLPGSARQHILRCGYQLGPTSPDHSRDFAVQCDSSSASDYPYDTQVRLVQGGTGFISSGFVEVYVNNGWGTVCNMNGEDADTACRQLGYTEAKYGSSSQYNSETDVIDDFNCDESQSCLRNCFHYPSYDYAPTCYTNNFVNCSFSESNKNRYGSGDETVCSLRSIIILALGVGIAVTVIFFLVLIACCIVCCCCIPGCLIHSSRRKVTYDIIQ